MSDLVIDDLTVEFAAAGYPVRPVDGFSARVPDGSLAVLLGPSGCGKTTLLGCVAGIQSPTEGTVRLGDVDVGALTGASLTRYRREHVGIVFQSFNLVPSLSALQNVMAPMLAAGAKRAEARERARAVLETVGLVDRARHRPGQLSGGQQQRVSLARALVHEPALVVADEPTANLDYVQVEGVLRLLRRLATPGRLVVVATHDDRLLPLADTVIEMVPAFRADGVEVIRETLSPGEVLFRQGSRGNRIYMVETGEVEVIRELVGGGHDLLARLGPGEHFGEMGPLFGIARSATVRAGAETVVAGYTAEAFRSLVGADRLDDLIRRDASL